MEKNLRWKGLFVLALTVVALLYLVPTLVKSGPDTWPKMFSKKITLGLTFRGGCTSIWRCEPIRPSQTK